MREPALATVQVQRDQGDGLAQAHVVGEAGAEPGAGELGQPGEAVPLVVAQRCASSPAGLSQRRDRRPRRRCGRAPSPASRRGAPRRAPPSRSSVPVSAACRATTGVIGFVRLPMRLRARRATSRVDDHPVVAQPDHRRRGLGERGHLVVGERVVAEGEPPVEARTARPARTGPPSAGPRAAPVRDLDPGLRDQLAAQAAGPEHVDAGARRGPRARARAGRPARRRRAPSGRAPAAAAAGPAAARPSRPGAARGSRLTRARRENPWSSAEPELVGVDDVGVVVHLVGLEHDDHAAALEHLRRAPRSAG